MRFVENLESRQLLSASLVPAVTRQQLDAQVKLIKLDEKALKSDFNGVNTGAKADTVRVALDLKRLGIAKANKTDLSTLKTDAHHALSNFDHVGHSLANIVNKDIARLVRDEKKELRKPSSAQATLVSNDVTNLNNDLTSAFSAITVAGNSAITAVDTDSNVLGNLSGADAQTRTDVGTLQSDLATSISAINHTAFNTDIRSLIDLVES